MLLKRLRKREHANCKCNYSHKRMKYAPLKREQARHLKAEMPNLTH